jgi:murein L,D-transpeptidase YcbB/YkuD
VESDGLEARDFHLGALEAVRDQVRGLPEPPVALRADYELLLSDALMRYVHCVRYGKVNPESLDVNWTITPDRKRLSPIEGFTGALGAADLSAHLDSLRPREPDYDKLREALARYQAIRAAGGWKRLAPAHELKLGIRDPEVDRLRFQLALTGDLRAPSPGGSPLFDRPLATALKAFQRRHALKETGKVDKATLAELQVPVEQRLETIRVNLERDRWVMHDLPDTLVLVNIAGFRIEYIREGRVEWHSRVQVGKVARQSPVIRSQLSNVVVNPTWTVPPVVLDEDILSVKGDIPKLLDKKGLKVINRKGDTVDATKLDWSKYTSKNFPYELRQDPGPKNALGQLKFNFPNRYSVYLHDTPHRNYFGKSDRALSSGCVRVENPLELAVRVLADTSRWNADTLRSIQKTRKTRFLVLKHRVPILLLYWTAWVDDEGEVRFSRDIYGRDPAILGALDREFRFRPRPGVRAAMEATRTGAEAEGQVKNQGKN